MDDPTDAEQRGNATATEEKVVSPEPSVSVIFTVTRRWLQSSAATVYRGKHLDDVVPHIHHWLMEISKDPREYDRVKKLLLDNDLYRDTNYELQLGFEPV